MPLVATRGAASAQGFGEFAQGAAPVYIEDVMSVFLYTGNGSSQTITNGIDLSTYGGLVWFKCRTLASNNRLTDTVRGAGNSLISNSTLANQTSTGSGEVSSFTSTGYTTNLSGFNSTDTYVSWTFRKQPKFFDVVTFTQSGTSGYQTINHNLGSVPGVIIIKGVGQADGWFVYHRSIPTQVTYLNQTNAAANFTLSNSVTSTTFNFNLTDFGFGNGATYVAYLFAHNAGGFGLTGTDNVISCGSFTVNGSGDCSVSLGYEPQWLMVKSSTAIDNWYLYDNMRGFPVAPSDGELLRPNTSQAGITASTFRPTSTGFVGSPGTGFGTGIYIAIRRGPMKTPTSGTSVYNGVLVNSSNSTQSVDAGWPVDLVIKDYRDLVNGAMWFDRLRGITSSTNPRLLSATTGAEVNSADINGAYQTGVTEVGIGTGYTSVDWFFRRAPGFFDEVCYTGDGTTNRDLNHNLTVAPELLICKRRSGVLNWHVLLPSGNVRLFLNSTSASPTYSGAWSGTTPTATTFSLGGDADLNASGSTYVTYLFATVAGVSKVGSYTGTGALQTINCGFTSGARFVLIKRTDSTGDWYVYDSARGITSGNDPYLFLNSTAAEVTGTNYVDTDTTGFKVTAAAPAGLNASGGTYIFLAVS